MFKGHFPTASELKVFADAREDMKLNGNWYLNGQLVTEPKLLALGRSSFYIDFLRDLETKTGCRFFQSDFMTWPDMDDYRYSLAYFIDTAESIRFSLRGIPTHDVELALGTREELRFMTLWEIRYIQTNGHSAKCHWYTELDATADVIHRFNAGQTSHYSSDTGEWTEEAILRHLGVIQ